MSGFLPERWTKASVCPSGESEGEVSAPGMFVSRRYVAFDPLAPAVLVRPRRTKYASPAPARRLAATRSTGMTGRRRRVEMTAAWPVVPESASMSNARSCAEWNRCSGFFSRQWRTMRSMPGETFWLVMERSAGSSLRIAAIVSPAESAWNARLPESIS